MTQFSKSYHLFLCHRLLRLIMYLVYPVLVTVLFALLYRHVMGIAESRGEANSLIHLILFALTDATVSIEIFADSMIFGGIAAKDTHKLEYWKTSAKGMLLLKNALITDGVRRVFSLFLITAGFRIIARDTLTTVNALSLLLLLFSYIEAGLIIIRHFPSMPITIITSSVIMAILPTSILLLTDAAPGIQIIFPLLSGIMIALAGRWLIIAKVRNSYYDNRNEKSN